MAEKAQILIDIESEGAAKNLGQLEDRAEKLAEALRGAELGSAEYKKLNQELVQTNKQVKNLELGFEALDKEQVASEIGSVAGAIGDVTASMILLGGENENLEKMAANIEQALGVSMAFKGAIEGFSSAMKLFNNVLKANPIFLLATVIAAIGVGIGFLIAKWDEFTGFLIDTRDAVIGVFNSILNLLGVEGDAIETNSMKEKKAFEEKTKQQKEIAKQHQARLDQLKKEQEKLEESHKKNQERYDVEIQINENLGKSSRALTIDKLNDQITFQKEQSRIINEQIQEWTKYYEDLFVLSGKSREDFIAQMKGQGIDLKKLLEEATELQEKADQQVRLSESELQKTKNDFAKEDAEKAKAKYEKEMERLHNLQQQRLDFLAELEQAENDYYNSQLNRVEIEIQNVQDKYFRLIEEAKKYGQDISVLEQAREAELNQIRTNEALKNEKALSDLRLSALDQEFKDREFLTSEDFLKRQEILFENLEAEKELKLNDKSLTEEEIFLIEEEYRQKKEAAEADTNEKIKANREATIAAAKQGGQDLLNSLEAFANMRHQNELKRAQQKVARGEALTKAERKRLERQEKIQKAFALAQIAIDTAKGIAGAVSSAQSMPYPGNLVAIATGIAAVIGGIVQATQALGESPDIPADPAPVADALSQADAGAQNTPATNDFGFGSTQLGGMNKVYVVESEITTTQNNVKAIEAQASFG